MWRSIPSAPEWVQPCFVEIPRVWILKEYLHFPPKILISCPTANLPYTPGANLLALKHPCNPGTVVSPIVQEVKPEGLRDLFKPAQLVLVGAEF